MRDWYNSRGARHERDWSLWLGVRTFEQGQRFDHLSRSITATMVPQLPSKAEAMACFAAAAASCETRVTEPRPRSAHLYSSRRRYGQGEVFPTQYGGVT